jgi:hypothetical protein
MADARGSLEQFWDNLLSRQSARVRATFATLNEEGRRAALSHLQRMASEPGWHPEQRASAEAALEALMQVGRGKGE